MGNLSSKSGWRAQTPRLWNLSETLAIFAPRVSDLRKITETSASDLKLKDLELRTHCTTPPRRRSDWPFRGWVSLCTSNSFLLCSFPVLRGVGVGLAWDSFLLCGCTRESSFCVAAQENPVWQEFFCAYLVILL